MFRQLRFLLGVMVVSIVMAGPALAENKNQMQKKTRQVQGEVLKMKQVEVRGANVDNIVVMLRTHKNDRRLVVDLGPTKVLEQVQLKQGDRISVEGRMARVRDRHFLVADRMKVNDQVVQVSREAQENQFSDFRKKADQAKRQKMQEAQAQRQPAQSKKQQKVTVVQFFEGGAMLSQQAKEDLRQLVSQAKMMGDKSRVTVAVYSDQVLPSQMEPTGADVALAESRAERIRNYLVDQLDVAEVVTVNMAYQRDDLVGQVEVEDVELESGFARKGEKPISKEDAQLIREKGDKGAAVVLIESGDEKRNKAQRSPSKVKE